MSQMSVCCWCVIVTLHVVLTGRRRHLMVSNPGHWADHPSHPLQVRSQDLWMGFLIFQYWQVAMFPVGRSHFHSHSRSRSPELRGRARSRYTSGSSWCAAEWTFFLNNLIHIVGHALLPQEGKITSLLPHREGRSTKQNHQDRLKNMMRSADPILLNIMIAGMLTMVMISKFCSCTATCVWCNLVTYNLKLSHSMLHIESLLFSEWCDASLLICMPKWYSVWGWLLTC
jgi:hypothetical protein